ncbi:ROK family transcriptional regulator [Streptomyces sp. CA-249302]|uniref:ROK family transcriptional regulator n=1 Tax=Streptomyces sp. CA-249302 TaxID=3240058 RepID=UPI003D946F85
MSSEQAESLAAVLRAIRSGAAVTQPGLVRHLGLGRGVVTARMAELEQAGLVATAGVAPSTGGRQPRRLRLRSEAGLIVGVDIGATVLKIGLADLSGHILDRVVEPMDVATGPDAVLGRCETLIDALLASRPADQAVWGVGVGVPGPVQFSTGLTVAPPIMPGWDGYSIRERFAPRWSAPTWVDNDVNLMALGELRANPAAAEVRNLLYVKIGTGIGAGLVSGGRLHRGSEGCAGDIGHITVTESEDAVCRCGNTGCLEALAGGAALAAQGQRLAEAGGGELTRILAERSRITAADIATAAEFGDMAARALLLKAGKLIGSTLATLVSFYNPGWVALGGNVISTGDMILTQIQQTVRSRSLPLATRRLRIERSSLGTEAGLSGAVHLVADELFEPRCLASWVPHSTPAGRPELASSTDLDVAA